MKTLGLIHTSATLVPVFRKLCDRYLKDANLFNIVDDSLIGDVIKKGRLTSKTARRVVDYVGSAEEAGADFILVTCSSIGAAVEQSVPLTHVPVLRVDQPMADLAVQKGEKIGVVATLPTTLEPTCDLVKRRAKANSREIKLTSVCCDEAFEALMNGHAEKHDRIVASALKELSEKVDVILLAQASMARVVDQLPEEDKKVPILASPELAVKHIASIL